MLCVPWDQEIWSASWSWLVGPLKGRRPPNRVKLSKMSMIVGGSKKPGTSGCNPNWEGEPHAVRPVNYPALGHPPGGMVIVAPPLLRWYDIRASFTKLFVRTEVSFATAVWLPQGVFSGVPGRSPPPWPKYNV